MNKHPLLIENERIEYLLENVVSSFTSNSALREDLMQEARIHLWRLQCDRPGQTLSWYLRSCRFRLQHYLAMGRSLDSSKRRAKQLQFLEADCDTLECLEEISAEDCPFDEACVRDLIATLANALKPGELAVLHCLADGLPTSLIVKRLNLSSPTVTKYRRKIAKLAVKLGIAAPSRARALRLRGTRRPASHKLVPRRPAFEYQRRTEMLPPFNVVGLGFRATPIVWREPITHSEQAVNPAA